MDTIGQVTGPRIMVKYLEFCPVICNYFGSVIRKTSKLEDDVYPNFLDLRKRSSKSNTRKKNAWRSKRYFFFLSLRNSKSEPMLVGTQRASKATDELW